MNTSLSSPEIAQKTISRLRERGRLLAPFAGVIFVIFLLTGLARGLFPGVYTFDPFDQGWLLIPEAILLGPVLALLHHSILAPGETFAWSRDAALLKLAKAAAYFYVLLILFKLGVFVTSLVIPSLVGYVFGPAVGALFPVIVGVGLVLFMLVYVRLVLVYPILAGETREPLIASMGLTKGKTRQIVSCLLLLVAPVLIPWIAASAYGGDWLNPSRGPGILFMPILMRSLLLTLGALLISGGLCVIYETLCAEEGETSGGETDQDVRS